jgi:hypothetical protein
MTRKPSSKLLGNASSPFEKCYQRKYACRDERMPITRGAWRQVGGSRRHTTAVGVLSFALPRLRVARLALFSSCPFFLVFFFSVPVFACIADLANEKRIVQYEDALVFDLNTFVLQDSWTSFTKELFAKSRAVMSGHSMILASVLISFFLVCLRCPALSRGCCSHLLMSCTSDERAKALGLT